MHSSRYESHVGATHSSERIWPLCPATVGAMNPLNDEVGTTLEGVPNAMEPSRHPEPRTTATS